MFILNENKKSLDPNFLVNKAMISMNSHNLASSTGQSGEAKGILVLGTLDDVPYIFVVITFSYINDIYESDALLMNEDDIGSSWHEGIVFLEELGFYLDDIDIVSIKEDTTIFTDLVGVGSKVSNAVFSDEESDEVIDFLTSF